MGSNTQNYDGPDANLSTTETIALFIGCLDKWGEKLNPRDLTP